MSESVVRLYNLLNELNCYNSDLAQALSEENGVLNLVL